MVAPDPSVRDDMERARTVVYKLTPRALDWFQMRTGPSKVGDQKHVRVIEKLLKEEYWPMGYYCVVDWGESGHERPDIAVLKPALTTIEDKAGNELTISNPYAWDYASAIAVEVEMSPQKSREQVLKNYSKDKGVYTQIRFVVTSENHAQQLQRILGEGTADPAKYRIDVIEFQSLNEIEVKSESAEGEDQPKESGQEPILGKVEERILSYIMTHGFTSREDIAEKCGGAGIEMAPRSVSRYLGVLTACGFLRRVGNGYEPTDSARKRSLQGTL
jgi:hypothetical protein